MKETSFGRKTCFMKCPAAVSLKPRLPLRPKLPRGQNKATVTSESKAVDYLLETYATSDVIAKTDDKMMPFTQPPSKLATDYSEALWNEILELYPVYNKYHLECTLIGNLPKSTRQSMMSYWVSKMRCIVQNLARYPKWLT